MKIGSSLALICIGAILAFAVTGNISFINLHTAGWVLMLVGVIGLLLPNRTAGWLGRRLLVRRTYPGGRVEHIPVPPYVARNPGTAALEAGIPSRPTLLDEENRDLIEETEGPVYPAEPGFASSGRARYVRRPTAATEVIEDLYEQP
jgi:Domain of unknown function (DUF6458)